MATILLVDDNPELLHVYGELLAAAGHVVETADNGALALEYLDERDSSALPDLVLLDMEMPVMDGFETARRIRERDGLDDLVVIALTSHELPEQVEDGLAAGCDGYIVKPTRAQDLLAELALIFDAADAR